MGAQTARELSHSASHYPGVFDRTALALCLPAFCFCLLGDSGSMIYLYRHKYDG
ncbi:hypothetical protein BO70DRAFT_358823 [Aspergillus heteromorphus CBS 117.55]|uniref:Uncharacterized protein n=1 Tax=Aspergillus heteromorphus CBS 117.55 TaxID=1448321 RepID=A0A317WUN9_9EURO|nr:uncharacterized protein BO70DRAFT_358823 [Aspergillus heteromorphus CBS 117.55]PWY89795.1 hypothetical protein BO70DRAFT_358823 [Aspergillus heteromorphus CBS 117.55]